MPRVAPRTRVKITQAQIGSALAPQVPHTLGSQTETRTEEKPNKSPLQKFSKNNTSMGRKTKEAEERHNQREKARGRELRKVKKEKEEKEKQRKAKKAESQRQLRARKKQEQQSLSESSDGRPPLPVGETMSSNKIPSTPMNEREPLPVQTPSPYPHHNNAILARATTYLQQTPISWQSHIPPGMANATPEQLNEFMSMQTLMMAQQTTNEIVAKVYSRREAAAPRRNLNATTNEARAPPPSPPLIEDSRASITPEPFPSDNWHVETPDQCIRIALCSMVPNLVHDGQWRKDHAVSTLPCPRHC
jgi:hypothetical protein